MENAHLPHFHTRESQAFILHLNDLRGIKCEWLWLGSIWQAINPRHPVNGLRWLHCSQLQNKPPAWNHNIRPEKDLFDPRTPTSQLTRPPAPPSRGWKSQPSCSRSKTLWHHVSVVFNFTCTDCTGKFGHAVKGLKGLTVASADVSQVQMSEQEWVHSTCKHRPKLQVNLSEEKKRFEKMTDATMWWIINKTELKPNWVRMKRMKDCYCLK